MYALYINVISFVKFIMLLIHLKLLSANISNINSAQDIRLKPSINIKYFPKVLKSSKPQLSSSGSSLTFWLTPGQVYEKSREDPEIGFVMG